MIRTLTSAICLSLVGAAAFAETRELGAHQHGHGALNIAFEGSSVLMELEVPGADIVGFEHEAKSAEDRALIDAAIADLAKPLELFVIPAAAGCTVTAAAASLVGEEGHEDHGHGHKDEHGHDHGDKDGHAHEEADAGHTEFHAEYALACSDPTAIDAIDFVYFERFPNAQELDIQLISGKGAKGYEVERDEPRLPLSGAI